jgi:hypothetical protein
MRLEMVEQALNGGRYAGLGVGPLDPRFLTQSQPQSAGEIGARGKVPVDRPSSDPCPGGDGLVRKRGARLVTHHGESRFDNGFTGGGPSSHVGRRALNRFHVSKLT